MELDRFLKLTDAYCTIPVYERMTADFLTPVSAFLNLRENGKNCFLFESVEGIGTIARYSFIGINPGKVYSNRGMTLEINDDEKRDIVQMDIFELLALEISKAKTPRLEDMPDFTGGLVGYLGFENASLIENCLEFNSKDTLNFPDSIFGLYYTLVVFDHLKHQIIIIHNVEVKKDEDQTESFYAAKKIINQIRLELIKPFVYKSDFRLKVTDNGNHSEEEFLPLVAKAKKHIFDGDVFQLVLSRRFNSGYNGDLFNVYRALRIINPSPYMYFIEFENDITIIGTSPEDLLKVKDGKATILPIAGTRPRGKDSEQDLKLAAELMADSKEIAEHVMLVDLARNDLGRVCKFGSVKQTEKMMVHFFSHVMHLVSRVEGTLNPEMNCIDALKAAFPAGTVSGAPKIKAMQLINDYEHIKRNIYAGAVGYIDFKGNLDMCIAIRTLFANSENIFWQAGAGIVADSIPESESDEIKNKSAVLVNALKFAEVIDENSGN